MRVEGTSLQAAFPQVTPNAVGPRNLDLIKIVNEGGNVLLNVDYAGAVHNPAIASPVGGGGVRIGRFLTKLTGTPTTAQLFADVFFNPKQEDILQNRQIGGNISYYLDYQGVAHGS